MSHVDYARKLARIAQRRLTVHVELVDLESEAIYGLVRGGRLFQRARWRTAFSTFIHYRIIGTIQDYLDANNQRPFAELPDGDPNEWVRRNEVRANQRPFAELPDGDPNEWVRRNEVRAAVETLPARWRLVLKLRFWHGFTQNETAKHLNIGACRVGQIQRQAFARLRDVLENV